MRIKPSSPRLNRAHPLAQGLVGAWAFHEGAGNILTDLSGYDNDGTLVNGPTWAAGQSGAALRFDGVDDEATNSSFQQLESWPGITLAAWVNLDAASGASFRELLTIGGAGGSSAVTSIGLASTANVRFQIRIKFANASLDRSRPSGWSLLGLTYDKSQLRTWINGSVQSSSESRDLQTVTSLAFGSRSGTRYCPCDLGATWAWSRALSDQEMLGLSADPWAIYRTTNRVSVFFGAAGGGEVAAKAYYYRQMTNG